MEGIKHYESTTYKVFFVETLSLELQNEIRSYCNEICFGYQNASRAKIYPKNFEYEKSVKDFLDRLNKKSVEIQKGMIGEFLTHILIKHYFLNYKISTPFFNLEEKSIKKGFDIVLVNNETNELWITEVKSGEKNKKNSSTKQIEILLNRAKDDLKKRLNSDNNMLWQNAINGCLVSMQETDDLKNVVLDLLYSYSNEMTEEINDSKNKNIIASAVLFSEITDKFSIDTIKIISDKWNQSNQFKNVIIIAIQENTYQEIINFMKSEVNCL